jgi:hypothetical protein
MSCVHVRPLRKAALLPAALLMAICGPGAAFASTSPGDLAKGASASASYYTMQFSSPAATVRAGRVTRTLISFQATNDLYGTPVNLSVSGLPSGATASFSPRQPVIGGRPVLTITTARSSPSGTSALTVTAITASTDPIGTSATFTLTIRAR